MDQLRRTAFASLPSAIAAQAAVSAVNGVRWINGAKLTARLASVSEMVSGLIVYLIPLLNACCFMSYIFTHPGSACADQRVFAVQCHDARRFQLITI